MNNKIKAYINREVFAHAMLDKYFPKAPTKIISDIGAGFGFMKPKIESLGATWQPFDYVKKIDETTIWDLNKPAPNSATRAGTIILLEVLEHLPNPLLSLQNIANHIENEGVLVLTTPNPQSSKNRINLALKGTLYAFQEKHLKEHHVFTPWEHIVKYFLTTLDFEILEYAIVDTAYKEYKSKSLKGKMKRMVENYIEKRNPKAQGMSYGLVAKKIK